MIPVIVRAIFVGAVLYGVYGFTDWHPNGLIAVAVALFVIFGPKLWHGDDEEEDEEVTT